MSENLQLQRTQNPNGIRLSNKCMSISFNDEGKAYSLKHLGQEYLKDLRGEPQDPDRQNSFYCDYHTTGKTVNLHPSVLKVIENSNKQIHIAFIDDKGKLGLAYHIILNSNDSGLYSYVKVWNNSKSDFSINELRTVYRLNHKLFPIGFNGSRTSLQPTSEHMMIGKKIQDETYLMSDGSMYDNSRIYSKYDYANYFKDTDFWGFYGSKQGFWIIAPDKSSYGCGPLNQDLMVHYDAIALNYLASEHFGKGIFKINPSFNKVYGPWFIYLNNGSLQDVQNRANFEKKHWPSKWIDDSDLPSKLYSLSGEINTEYQAKNCTVVLTSHSNQEIPIYQQQDSFSYYSKTDNGKFVLRNIRPGHYWLYAYENYSDDVDIHLLKQIDVIDQDLNLGLFQIKRKYKSIWQIGLCTHTTTGFKFSDQLRNYCWKNLVPQNLNYVVGKSTDWYYLQNDLGKWNIYFCKTSSLLKSKSCTLLFSLAGATQKEMQGNSGCEMKIYLNDQLVGFKAFTNDRSAYRSALKNGRYHLWKIKIPTNNLRKRNVISICTNGYLMYDTIALVQPINNNMEE